MAHTKHCQWGLKPQNCPFPLVFHHHAGGRPSHSHGQQAQKKFGKDCSVVREISLWTDRHTQTCSSQYFATTLAAK